MRVYTKCRRSSNTYVYMLGFRINAGLINVQNGMYRLTKNRRAEELYFLRFYCACISKVPPPRINPVCATDHKF